MHELTLAHSVAEIAAGSWKEHGESDRVKCVRLRIGDLAGVDPEALAFCFEVVRGEWEELRDAVLDIQRCLLELRCLDCGGSREWAEEVTGERRCPECGGGRVELKGGRELEVTGVEWIAQED